LCTTCAPNFVEQLAASQAQAKVTPAREQLVQKAHQFDYAGGVDMAPDAQVAATTAATNTQASKALCGHCGTKLIE
jgi:hypothetical protein